MNEQTSRRGSRPRSAAQVVLSKRWDKDTRQLLMEVMAHPELRWARPTKNGVILLGPTGRVAAHATPSDRRARANLVRDLKKAGLR